MVELTTTLRQLDSAVYYQAFYVPATTVAELVEGERRVICCINGGYEWHAALMHDGKGDYFINVSKEVRKATGIEKGDEVVITLRKDESKYGMPLPTELAELCEIDPEAKEVFHQLTRGKQRNLLHVIGKPKNSETRIKKAVQIMEYLKSTGGKLDFKELNKAMKNANRIV
ncbi:MAG: YdeI/OmpD-associated family protein [Bacteroidota bacterium]